MLQAENHEQTLGTSRGKNRVTSNVHNEHSCAAGLLSSQNGPLRPPDLQDCMIVNVHYFELFWCFATSATGG